MKAFIAFFLFLFPAASADLDSSAGQVLDRIVGREKALLESLRPRSALVETYIQETAGEGDVRPSKDHYFLGQINFGSGIEYTALVERTDPGLKNSLWLPFRLGGQNQRITFQPRGFAQMAFPDLTSFNRQTYRFEFVRSEFLGEVRCLVFDVTPIRKNDTGRFEGRIWVEDRGDALVRSNGIYVQAPARGTQKNRYFHFDSWRVNVAGDVWAPAQIYVEEEGSSEQSRGSVPRFKAQTRIWGYNSGASARTSELTQIRIESSPDSDIKDLAAQKDFSPLESQRFWERQAEENVLGRLEKSGLLALPGPVDELLSGVANNLIVSAKLGVDVHCRVLLTTPLETFSIGRTIVISRGLIDVVPDESSLALVLAGELSHVVLGHPTPTQFAFRSETMMSDAELLQRLHFARSTPELEAAAKETIEIMRASPYQMTGKAALFLKALASRSGALPRLLAANLGNQLASQDALARLAGLASAAPELQENELQQIAALPLGSRIKLDPWSARIALIKTRPLDLLSPREKMPFEIAPFVLYLTRVAE